MYNINELEAMPLEEVKAYAKSIGIKKVDSETLVYDILDQQANIASTSEQKKATEPKKRKTATKSAKQTNAADKPKRGKKAAEEATKTEDTEKVTKNKKSLCSVHKSVFYRKIKNRGVNAPRFFHDTTVSLPSSPNFTGTISFRVFLAMSSMRSLEG